MPIIHMLLRKGPLYELLMELPDYVYIDEPAYFHHCFKASTGQTLRVYVEEQRIKRAANLLTTTDYTLTKIAYECGFSSQAYFSYAFKRKMKSTPREYARRMLERYSD